MNDVQLQDDKNFSLLFAVGDINGCPEQLKIVLNKIEMYKLSKNDKVIFLGNYVEEGPSSMHAIELCMAFQKKYPKNTVFLRGQADSRFLRSKATYFADIRGASVIKSYRKGSEGNICYSNYTMNELLSQDLMRHRRWLGELDFFYESERYFFCPSGINPQKELGEQALGSLCFNSHGEEFLKSTRKFEKTIIHGTHKSYGKVEIKGNRINVNSVPASTKVLSCVVLNDKAPEWRQVLTSGPAILAK